MEKTERFGHGGLLQLLDCLTAEEGLRGQNVLFSIDKYYVISSKSLVAFD